MMRINKPTPHRGPGPRGLRLAFALAACLPAGLVAQGVPRLEPADACPMAVPSAIEGVLECGWLMAAERADQPDSGTVRLAYAVARATGPSPRPDPVVVIFGGPGGPSLSRAARLIQRSPWVEVLDSRDIVLLDARGTGFSEPRVCTEVDEAVATEDIIVVASPEVNERLVAAAEACAASALRGGADPGAYGSPAVARDLEQLRSLLGYERWNVWGVSYGGRYAQSLMRDWPDPIRSVVLDSPVTLGQMWSRTRAVHEAMQAVFAQCRDDEECARAFPDLEAEFDRLLSDLGTEPFVLEVHPALGLPNDQFVLTRELLVRYIQRGLARGYLPPVLPLLIHRAASGQPEVLQAFLPEARQPSGNGLAEGLALATLCYDESGTTPEALAEVRAQFPLLDIGGWYDARIHPVCPSLHGDRASEEEWRPADTGIPTLVLGGALDHTVPLSMVRFAAEAESGASLIVLPTGPHSVTGLHQCVDAVIAGFFVDPLAPAEAACAEEEETIDFVADARPVAGLMSFASIVVLSGSDDRLAGVRRRFDLWVIPSTLVLLLSPLIWALVGLWRRFRPSGSPDANEPRRGWAIGLAVAACAVGVACVVGVRAAVSQTLLVSPALLGIGVPSALGWVFLLPWLLAALALAMALTSWAAWRGGWWVRWMRVHYALVALATVSMASFLWYWPLV